MYDTDEDSIAERVDRGVTFLDSVFPEWRDVINPSSLDLSEPESCVIGQTFCHGLLRDRYESLNLGNSPWSLGTTVLAEFEEQHDLLDGSLDVNASYGFEREGVWETYDLLQEEWLKRI